MLNKLRFLNLDVAMISYIGQQFSPFCLLFFQIRTFLSPYFKQSDNLNCHYCSRWLFGRSNRIKPSKICFNSTKKFWNSNVTFNSSISRSSRSVDPKILGSNLFWHSTVRYFYSITKQRQKIIFWRWTADIPTPPWDQVSFQKSDFLNTFCTSSTTSPRETLRSF